MVTEHRKLTFLESEGLSVQFLTPALFRWHSIEPHISSELDGITEIQWSHVKMQEFAFLVDRDVVVMASDIWGYYTQGFGVTGSVEPRYNLIQAIGPPSGGQGTEFPSDKTCSPPF